MRSTVRDQRGSVLLGSLMLVSVLTLVGVSLFDVSLIERRLVIENQKGLQLRYAAEAGISRAQLYWEKGLTSACGTVATMPSFDAVYAAAITQPLCAGGAFGNLATGTAATYTVSGIKWDPVAHPADAARPCTLPTGATTSNCVKVISTACVTPADPKAPCVSIEANVAKVATVTSSSSSVSSSTSTTSYLTRYPFYAGDKLTLNTSEIVDSFNSSGGGTYAGTVCRAVGCGADLWTNGTVGATSTTVEDLVASAATVYGNITLAKGEIKLGSNAAVYGNITYDTGDGSLLCNPSPCTSTQVKGTVNGVAPGSSYPSTTVNPVTLPSVPNCTTDTGAVGGTDAQDPSRNHTSGFTKQSWVASHVTGVGFNAATDYNETTGVMDTRHVSITITPGTYCFGAPKFGDLSIPSNPASPVVIKLTDDTLFNGSLINNTGVAANLQLLSSLSSTNNGINIGSDTSAYVYIYAPDAQVLLSGHGDVYGAAMGRVLTTSGSSNLHYDKALGLAGGGLALGSPTTVTTTTTTTTTTFTTVTRYARQRWTLCPVSGCA